MHWQALVAKLMQRIPPVPLVNPPKEDKLADKVAILNPKTYGETHDPMKLEKWIRGMEKILAVINVPEEKRVKIKMFFLLEK